MRILMINKFLYPNGGSELAKLTYPLKTIYSAKARKKLRLVLEDFRQDILHINNVEYQGLSEEMSATYQGR